MHHLRVILKKVYCPAANYSLPVHRTSLGELSLSSCLIPAILRNPIQAHMSTFTEWSKKVIPRF